MPRPLTTAPALALVLALALLAGCGGGGGPSATTTAGPTYEGFGPGTWPPATWRPYADDAIFNTRVDPDDARPVASSDAMVARVLSWGPPSDITAGLTGTAGDFDHPVFFARASDPLVRLAAHSPYGRNPLTGRSIRIPAAARPAAGGDAHLAIVEPDGTEYDFWQVRGGGVRDGVLDFGWGGRARIDGPGTDGAATAAGYGLLAGAIRPEELAAGRIDHALFLVQRCVGPGRGYVVPPEAKGSPCGADERDAPPLGAHYVLAMSDAQIDALGAPPWKVAILRALAHYGGYVGDTGAAGLGFIMQSGETYTAYGAPDRLVQVARDAKVPAGPGGTYRFDVASGVDWARYLRIVPAPRG